MLALTSISNLQSHPLHTLKCSLFMIKVIVAFGTRPEAIKLAPVVKALQSKPDLFTTVVCATSQHRQMLDQALAVFALKPDYDLDVMAPNQTLTSTAARVMERFDQVLATEQPDWVLVQGDTTTVLAASLAAFYRKVKVGHVEAGLRSGDRNNPFPEEVNRRLADVIADLHFAPTESSRDCLLREGVPTWRVSVTGNTVIDALLEIVARPYEPEPGALRDVWQTKRRIVLVTAHRRESFGAPLREMFAALRDIATAYANDVTIVYPVHLNPQVMEAANEVLTGVSNILLLPPLDYVAFVHLMQRAYLILTDSGGIQEEAPSLGRPVLVMRDVTERPEGITAGTALLVGSNRQRIVGAVSTLLDDTRAYSAMANAVNPYGDGTASQRIVQALLTYQPSSP